MAASGVVQQSALGDARGRIHLRATPSADDCFSYEGDSQPAAALASHEASATAAQGERSATEAVVHRWPA